jgi:hypothetical protein
MSAAHHEYALAFVVVISGFALLAYCIGEAVKNIGRQ